MFKRAITQTKLGFLLLFPILIWQVTLFWHWQILALWLVWIAAGIMEQYRVPKPVYDLTQRRILFASWLTATSAVGSWAYAGVQPVTNEMICIGACLMLLGLGLRFWALIALGANFSHTASVEHTQQIIRQGPYRVVRHPAYLGAMFLLLGQTLFLGGETIALCCNAVLFYAYHLRMRAEEKALSDKFGNDYVEYIQQTKKIIPFIY